MIPRDPQEPFSQGRELADPARLISPEEYLAFELGAETKHEYHDGQVYPMTGASPRHNRIVANLIVQIGGQLRGGPCRVYPSDLRLRVAATGLYTYPDVTVVCGTPEFGAGDTLLNPTLLIEVLSPATERYDRGRKSEHYRTIGSLREYLLVNQEDVRVERYMRTGERQRVLTDAIGAEDSIALDSIACVLSLSDIYEDID
jgi:Uma2 family endonuclease